VLPTWSARTVSSRAAPPSRCVLLPCRVHRLSIGTGCLWATALERGRMRPAVARWRLSVACSRKPDTTNVRLRRAAGGQDSATSGHSSIKKIASPTTGSRVQLTLTARSGEFFKAVVHCLAMPGGQGSTVCRLIKASDWHCRPTAVPQSFQFAGAKPTLTPPTPGTSAPSFRRFGHPESDYRNHAKDDSQPPHGEVRSGDHSPIWD
jgi:hypothetical protein